MAGAVQASPAIPTLELGPGFILRENSKNKISRK